MKTAIIILIVMMAFLTLYNACKIKIVNMVLAFVSLPCLVLFYFFLSVNDETEK